MTKQEWLEKVEENKVVLRELIADWHPAARSMKAKISMPITARAAERACETVREQIRNTEPEDPCERWDKAVAAGDLGELNSLLNAAWFGVPESSSCWSIPGFAEAVDLMEDLSEEMYGQAGDETDPRLDEPDIDDGLGMGELLTMDLDDLNNFPG